jgi:hypothetical protein
VAAVQEAEKARAAGGNGGGMRAAVTGPSDA